MSKPIISALVSTYNSERFMRGCLEDLEQQTIASQLEIIVVDSASTQNEQAIVRELMNKYKNIKYIRTDQREGLYEAWNRAVGMATGDYLTSANTDDRHRHDSFEILSSELEKHPECVLSYADQLTSTIENEGFESCLARHTRRYNLPDFSHAALLLGCLTGSQPMWRRSAHLEHGMFSKKYRLAADYEFWMRIAQTHQFVHVRQPLGVFFDSPHTLSGANNRFQVDTETLSIQLEYLLKEPWCRIDGSRAGLAKTIFTIGYHYVEKLHDPDKAKPFLKEAWKLDPTNFNLAKTFVLRGLLGIQLGLE